jgi:hypothetical protein
MYAIIPINYVLEVIENCYKELVPICPNFVLFAIDSSPQAAEAYRLSNTMSNDISGTKPK